MQHTELKLKARRKLDHGNQSDRKILKYKAIHDLTVKENLSVEDVAQLEHFVNSSRYTLDNTVYYANNIISPVTTCVRQYKISLKPRSK